MTAADWVILVAVLVSVVQAAISGFFQEAFSIAGIVLGYLLAAWNYQRVADHFAQYSARWLVEIAAFLIIFAVVMLLAGVAGRISRWVMKEAGLTFVDRVLGGALGLLRGCLGVAVVLLGMAAFTPTSNVLQRSELAPYFLVVGRAVVWVAPSELRARFYQGLDLLHQRTRMP